MLFLFEFQNSPALQHPATSLEAPSYLSQVVNKDGGPVSYVLKLRRYELGCETRHWNLSILPTAPIPSAKAAG